MKLDVPYIKLEARDFQCCSTFWDCQIELPIHFVWLQMGNNRCLWGTPVLRLQGSNLGLVVTPENIHSG